MTATVRWTDSSWCDAARLRVAVAATCLAAVLAASLPAPAQAARKYRKSALPAFGSCASLLDYAHSGARRTGGVTGVPTRAGAIAPQVLSAPAPQAVASDSSPPVAAT